MAKKSESILDVMRDEFEGAVIDEDEVVETIPTGSYSLDIASGIMGIPRGRFTELYGSESSGKTTLSLGIAKNAMLQGLKVFYVDVEQTLSLEYVEKIAGNVDQDVFTLVKPKTAEDAFVLMEKAIDSNEYGLIILDSVGALSPSKELEDKFEDANIALIPRLMAKFLRRNAFNVRVNNIAIVFINQVRDKIGAYMATFSTPGGHAVKHFTSLIVSLTKGADIKQGKDSIGITVNFTIKKNKLSKPGRGGSFPMFHGKGVDSIRDLVQFGERIGALEKSKSWYTFNGENIGHGLTGTVDTLSANHELLDKVIETCYNKANEIDVESEEDDGNE